MQLVGIVQQAFEPYDFNGAPACRVAVRYAGCTQTKTAVFIFYGKMAEYACTFAAGQKVRIYFDLSADNALTYSKVRARSIEPYEAIAGANTTDQYE